MVNIKRRASIFLLICSFIFLTFEFKLSLTGNFINEYFSNNFVLPHLIGLILFIMGIIFFLQKTSLDAIIIPTGGDEKNIKRTKRAAEEKAKYYLISGYIDKNEHIKNSQTAGIYRELRKYGIKPSEIKIENKAKDSLDNIIYSMNKLKGMKRIGIVSYPEHLKKFEYIINKAKKEGVIDKEIEKVYGVLANMKERYRLRNGIETAKDNKTGLVGNLIKKIVDSGATQK